MREPAIHISINSLTSILQELNINNPSELSYNILELSKEHSLKDRNIFKSNNIKEKINKKVKSSVNDDLVNTFNMILTSKRADKGFIKNISVIDSNNKLYPLLCEITEFGKQFYIYFNFSSYDIAFSVYIDIGLGLMKDYALGKFKYYNEKIFYNYMSYRLIKEDPHPEQLSLCINEYINFVKRHLNFTPEVNKQNEILNFIKIKNAVLESGVTFYNFFEAQQDNNGILDLWKIVFDLNASIIRCKRKYNVSEKELVDYKREREKHSSYYDLLDKLKNKNILKNS